MMLCLYYMLLSISALCYALPIEQDTHDNFNNTSSDSDVFFSNLLPPSSISDCLTSNYCNQGICARGMYLAIFSFGTM